MTNRFLVLVASKAKEAEAPMAKRSSLVSFSATVTFIQKSLQTAQKPRYKRLFAAEWNSKASSTLTAGAAIMAWSMLGYGKHLRVDHSKNEFAKGRNHINGIEGFWGYAKTRLFRFRGMAPSTFNLHLKECELDSITEDKISTS